MSSTGPDPASESRSWRVRREEPLEIPGYELLGLLGRGASGVVYRARQRAVDREVALKVLHAELSANPRVVQRLKREARTTARLAHPNVVSAIDMGETEGRWWYAMELVDGPTLSQCLRSEGRLNERDALRLFIPLCEALEHLWHHGVVHRDVKPANILIDRTGGARLADLGLAFADNDPSLTIAGATLGTPHYISPEQMVDPKSADIQSDIWSLGATLFHAVCGQPPFSGTSSPEILSAVLYERIPDPLDLEPELSRGLALVLRKCLVRDPERRYATPRELRLDLERVRERRAPAVRRSRLDPVRRVRSPRRAVWVAGLVALSLGGWWWWHALSTTGESGVQSVERTAWDPLEEITRRAREDENPIGLLAELAALAPQLGPEERRQADLLTASLRGRLRQRFLAFETGLNREVEERLAEDDIAGAWELVEDGLEPRAQAALGATVPRLREHGLSLDSWSERTTARLGNHTRRAVEELGRGLANWRRERLLQVDGLVAEGRLDEACRLLAPSVAELLSGAGLSGARYPEGVAEPILANEQVAFRLRRQRFLDDWALTDRVLRRFVVAKAAALYTDLDEAERIPDGRNLAVEELRAAFDAELEARRLRLDRLPAELARTCQEALEVECDALQALHARRVEETARAELDELETMASAFARRRAYTSAAALWDEAGSSFSDPDGRGGWRAELTRTVAVRAEEARLLSTLLESVADAVRALSERPADLRVGGIVYPGVRAEVLEPLLQEGFRLQGLPGRLYLQTIAATTFEQLAGLTPMESQGPLDRLRLASFRHAEGDLQGALQALDGPAPASEPWRSLARDLAVRLQADARARKDAAEERDRTARRYLDIAFDAERRQYMPRTVLGHVNSLLDDYGDLPVVGDNRERLLELRESLRTEDEPSDAAGFQSAYDPTALSFVGTDRVQLAYDFAVLTPGIWDPGDWVSDGVAWSLPVHVRTWGQLLRQRGARLVLRRPLAVDDGVLALQLEFEQPAGTEPRLVVVSAAGFHVALVGSGLPGADHEPCWLVGTESLQRFLERVRDGEGQRVDRLLTRGASHSLSIELNRRSGRIDLALDGEALGSVHPSPPDPAARALTIRSWDPVRLRRVVVEGER